MLQKVIDMINNTIKEKTKKDKKRQKKTKGNKKKQEETRKDRRR